MRIVFFGSPDDSLPALDALSNSRHSVLACYTQPDRKAGRGKKLLPTAVKIQAEELGIPVFSPTRLKGNDEEVSRLTELNADAFVVVSYGRILPKELLDLPKFGVINIHPSLLPKFRGPSPVVSAILEGVDRTGVSIMFLDEGMDTGPVLAQSNPVTLSGNELASELQRKLFTVGASLLTSTLDDLENGSAIATAQDDSAATVTSLIEKGDGEIDWSESAEVIDRKIRALNPWPGTFTTFEGSNLKILEANETSLDSQPGQAFIKEGNLYVGTGTAALQIQSLQLAGKPRLNATDFVSGYPRVDGVTLGS